MKAPSKKKNHRHKFFDYSYDRDGSQFGLIPPDLGDNIKWVHERDKHRYRTQLGPYNFHNGKRLIRLNLTSWAGISIGAIHHYATLEANSADCVNLTKKTRGHGGYVGAPKDHPRHNDIGARFSLTVMRRLTKVEKDAAGEPLGKVGEYTGRFNTEAEAKAQAIATFKKRFAPGWVLLEKEFTGDEEVVLAET